MYTTESTTDKNQEAGTSTTSFIRMDMGTWIGLTILIARESPGPSALASEGRCQGAMDSCGSRCRLGSANGNRASDRWGASCALNLRAALRRRAGAGLQGLGQDAAQDLGA